MPAFQATGPRDLGLNRQQAVDFRSNGRSAYLSVVVPIYNERDNIEPFHTSLLAVLRRLTVSWEVIYVDDGSTDGGSQLLARLPAEEPSVRIIHFRRNFGQTAAISAGFTHSAGEVVITMDGDCQNDPEDIPRLLAKLDEGYDVVSGWRAQRKDGQLLRKFPSKIANRLISSVTGVQLHDYGCTLKAYRREVIEAIRLYGEMHRFIPAYAAMVGASIAELPVKHHARTRGKSKYGLGRIYRVVLDLLTVKFLGAYATKPLYMFGRFALVTLALAAASFAAMLYLRITQGFFFINSPLLLLTAVLVIIASQTILLGLLGEMSVRTYHESQQKPTYTVRTWLGFEARGYLGPASPRHAEPVYFPNGQD